MDASLQLPESFSATFHADHADLGWMMTFCSSDPLEAACREIDARVGDSDPETLLKEATALLTALKDGTDLPATEGKTKEITDKINELNKGLNDLDAGALQLAEGAQQVSDGAAALNTGLGTLEKNNEALNSGAEQIFAAILNTANDQIAASGLADAGVTVPALTAENYAEILDGVTAQLEPDTLKAAASAKVAEEVRKQVTANEDQIRAGVQEAVKGKVLEAVLKAAGFEMTAEQYAAALKGGLVTKEQAAQVDTAVEAQMNSEEILAQTEAAVQEQIEKLVAENVEAYLAKDETVAAKLDQAAEAREQLTAVKEQLDQVNTFVTGLKDYTDGVAKASDAVVTLSAGATLVSTGASTLQETGTKTLKDSILTAEKSAAVNLLPLVEKNLTGVLNAWKTTKDHLTDTGYDLKPEGMDEETVYIIRTDLK
jgi:putative membrane protein